MSTLFPMDATAKKLLELLGPKQPAEVRRAAALVLGELGGRDGEVGEAMTGLLDDADAELRAEAITALGKLHHEKALKRLLERIEMGGDESELAAQAAARLGAKGTKALQELMAKVAPGLRRRIAGALGGGGTSSAETAAVAALKDTDPGVVEASTRSLIAQIPTLSEAHRRGLADHLLGLLTDKKSPLPPVSETAAVRLLSALKDTRADKVLWDRLLPGHPPEMRAAALQSLGKLDHPLAKEQMQRLLQCAMETDFRVAAPAMLILQNMPLDKISADWLALFRAGDAAVRRFAIEKLGDRDTAEVARALVEQLEHKDPALRDLALAALARSKNGRKAILQALLEAETPEQAWTLSHAQSAWAAELPPASRKDLLGQASQYLEKGDRRADALLHLLRQADASAVTDEFFALGVALRKKKQYEKALAYLRYLLRDPACAVAIRLEAAGCLLRLSSHELSAEGRDRDPALQQLSRLVSHYETETVDFIAKAKWLAPEDLFYAGFHFAEQTGPSRKFGAALLKLLVKKGGTSKITKDARAKLRSSGLE